jgi:hypothetical protein
MFTPNGRPARPGSACLRGWSSRRGSVSNKIGIVLTGSAAADGAYAAGLVASLAVHPWAWFSRGSGRDLNPVTGLSAEVQLDTDWTPT